MAVLFSVAVTIVIAGFLWFYVVRPILEDFEVIGPRTVNTFQEADPPAARIMSRETAQTGQTDRADRQTDRVSVADPWIERLKVDRTKTALIELLVDSAWGVGEIRSVLKGDTTVLGVEIENARKRRGAEPEEPTYRTPIVGRPTSAQFFETDPELAYQPPR